jgi:hypothetical protein
MRTNKTQRVVFIIAALAFVACANAPSWAAGSKTSARKSPASAAGKMGAMPARSSLSKPRPVQQDTKPGPAWRTVGGTVTGIQGDIYTVQDHEGNHMKLHVGPETKRLRGQKKVGDLIRAEITRGGFANSIQ